MPDIDEKIALEVDTERQEPGPEETTLFSDLPEELQLKIFTHFKPSELSKCIAPVCKTWWNLSKDASLWRDISFLIPAEKAITIYCEILLRCKLLNSLRIKSAYPLDCLILCFIQLRPLLLKKLDLGFCKGLNAEAISVVVSNSPLIEVLNLEGCGFGVDVYSINYIVTLQHLRSLNLSRCLSIDDECVKIIAERSQKLELLNLDNIAAITDDAICELAWHREKTLSHLFVDGEELTDRSMDALRVCRKLNTLCISCGEQLTGKSLEALSSLPCLTWFKLRESNNLSVCALQCFFSNSNLSSLQVLEFENSIIDDVALRNLSKICKNLRILTLSFCLEVTDYGLKAVIDNCPDLFWLDLTFMTQLTDESLHDIPTKLPGLKYLNLADCNFIGENVIQNLGKEMPDLKINCSFVEHFKHLDSEEELEVSFLVNKSLNVFWTKMPEGFCSRLGKTCFHDLEKKCE